MHNTDIQSKIDMLPEHAKRELFDFAEFLLSKYYKPLKKQVSTSKNKKLSSKFGQFRGAASVKMSTDEIMTLTRGDE